MQANVIIAANFEDAIALIREAASDAPTYAKDIITLYDKILEYEFTGFSFNVNENALLVERVFEIDRNKYSSITIEAPDLFFYSLFGGMSALLPRARELKLTGDCEAAIDVNW